MLSFLRLFLPILLRIHRLHKLRTGIRFILHLAYGLTSAIQDLQDQHGIVVNNIEKEGRVNEERQCYLDGDSIVILVDLRAENGGACEGELYDDEGNEVEDPSEVVVEEE